MNFRSGIRRDEPEINLIPMIDLLLVILIFLMVSTTYSKLTELEVSLPSAGSAKSGRRAAEVLVTVSADGRYRVGDSPAEFTGASRFATRLVEAAGREKDPVVVIQADAGAPHQAVVNVLDAARLAGFARIGFAAQSPAESRR